MSEQHPRPDLALRRDGLRAGRDGALLLHGVPGRVEHRFAAVVLTFEALALPFFGVGVRGLHMAQGRAGEGLLWVWVGLGLAAACVLAAGLLKRGPGVLLGWLVQLACLALASVDAMMLLVGLAFLALWAGALYWGRRMDAVTDQYMRLHPDAVHPDDLAPGEARHD